MLKSRTFRLSTLLISSFLFLIESCVSHELPTYTCPDTPISFLSDVQPIINTKCAISGCHNGDLGDERDWRQLSKIQDHKTVVKAYTRARIMPRAESTAGPLTQEQIDIISCWVDQGAQNN